MPCGQDFFDDFLEFGQWVKTVSISPTSAGRKGNFNQRQKYQTQLPNESGERRYDSQPTFIFFLRWRCFRTALE